MAEAESEMIDLTESAQSAHKDEFIIDMAKVKLISEVQQRIQDLFQVTFTLGEEVEDVSVGNKQWIQVEGTFDDRRLAKDYVRALCNPMEQECLRYPEELESVLTNPQLQGRIEKQSRAVIRYTEPGQISILGNEQLSVTLAYSALEDVISQYWDQEEWDVEQQLATPTASSSRLDAELLRRLSSEDGGTAVAQDELTSMNNAIKRALLDVLNTGDEQAQMEDYGIKPHGMSVPAKTTRQSRAAQSQSPRMLSSQASRTLPVRSIGDALIGPSLGDAARQLGQIQITKIPESDTGDEGTAPSSSSASQSVDGNNHLRNYALGKGYSADKVDQVFAKYGQTIKFHDFYRALIDLDKDVSIYDSGTGESIVSTTSQDADGESTTPSKDAEDASVSASQGAKGDSSATSKNGEGSPTPPLHSRQVVSYIARLSRDHVEEDQIENIDELKYRNSERQRLLMDVFEKRKARIAEDELLARTIAMEMNDSETPVNIDLTAEASVDDVDARRFRENPADRQHDRPDTHTNPVHRSRSPVRNQNNTNPHGARHNFLHGRSPSPKRYKMQDHQSPQHRQAQHTTQHIAPHTGTQDVGSSQSQLSKPAAGVKSNLRYIVIDGSNVAFTHGNGTRFSCRGIELCIEYFLKRGHKNITAFVPQWRTRTQNPESPISDQHLLEELRKRGYLVFTPSRRVPGKNIVPYDDRYVLRLAEETEGIIVSNDNYRDLWHEKREWRDIIEKSLVMFSFVMDIFMPPDDPLGKDGPTLDQLLQKTDLQFTLPFNDKWRSHNHQQYSQRGGNQARYHPPSILGPYNPQNNASRNQQHGNQVNYPRGSSRGNWDTRNNPQTQDGKFQSRGPRPQNNWNRSNNQFQQQSFVRPAQSQQQSSHWPAAGQQQSFQRPTQGQQQSHNPSQAGHSQTRAQGPSQNQIRARNTDNVDGVAWQQVPDRHEKAAPKAGKTRKDATTQLLLEGLKGVFFEQEDVIKRILRENPAEEDLNTLSEYVLNYIDDS